MDTQPIDTTDILARPREYAAKLETMRSALEAVTAQLAAVTAERDEWRRKFEHMEYLGRESDTERADRAEAEVALANVVIDEMRAELQHYRSGSRIVKAEAEVRELRAALDKWKLDYSLLSDDYRALRGDTAPAQAEAGE